MQRLEGNERCASNEDGDQRVAEQLAGRELGPGQKDKGSDEPMSSRLEGGVSVNLCAGPSRVTGEVQVINANTPGSTLYMVEGVKVCNLSREEEGYKSKRGKLEFFMHHPFPA